MFGLSSLAWKVLGYAVIALVISGVVFKVTHQYALGGQYHAAAVSQAKEGKRVNATNSAITVTSTRNEVAAQAKIVVRYRTIVKEVPTYVTVQQDARGCVSWGLVRLLDAAALGVDPSTLDLPSDVTDDTCTTLKASDLAASVAGNYGVAAANAEQLDALEADIKARVAVAPVPPLKQ